MKLLIRIVLLLMLGFAVFLLSWPTAVAPVAWTAPVAPSNSTGPYALNEKLKGLQRLALGVGEGPEGITIDAAGNVYAGYLDGRVIRLDADGANHSELGNTGGRPLGIALQADGSLVIADAVKGLLAMSAKTPLTVLSTAAAGTPFKVADDVDVSHDGKYAYFSDASSKFALNDYPLDLLEHQANGRLLRYDFGTKTTDVLLDGLYFANGVTLGPDDAYVLVNETGAYRITRYWLKGDKAGSHDVFVDNLPGFPDNLSFNGHDRFWVALASPRNPQLDDMAGKPWLRKVVARLPKFLQPGPVAHSIVLGFDVDGKLVANLQYKGSDAYAPITSVEEHGPWLYFGSLSAPSLARMPLSAAIDAARASP